MKYTIFISNGKIIKLVDCDDIDEQLSADEYYIEGWFLDSEYYIFENEPVLLPPKPNDYFIFDYDIKQWIDTRTPQIYANIVCAERNKKLQLCDWTQLPDVPLGTKQAWVTYRQALRDITDQAGYPFNIVWPTPPTQP